MRRWKTTTVKIDDDLAHLFPIRPQELTVIIGSMRERGYDEAEPLVIWEQERVVVDGHTRLEAAKQAELDYVYVDVRPFEDKRDALEYAIRRQRDRRNLTAKELIAFRARAIEALDKVKPQGQRSDLASGEARSGKSAAETAELVGTSRATVERTRAVMASVDEQTKTALKAGEVSVNEAYRAVKEARAAGVEPVPSPQAVARTVPLVVLGQPASPPLLSTYSVPTWEALDPVTRAAIIEHAPQTEDGLRARLNEVNENIDWAKWSWNPVTGCLHNCAYCYARDIATRRYEQGFVPTFLPARLHAPRQTGLPKLLADPKATPLARLRARNVFVCSMADLFGNWVPQEWIDAVFAEIVASPQWNFLCLTKFPQRLAELDWPKNAWCGTTVDYQHRVATVERSFRNVKAGVKWLSCEPMMERLTFSSLEMFDWVVIGAASKSTQTPEFQPPYEWIQHLKAQADAAGCKVYEKPNLKNVRRQEYPEGVLQ